MVGAVLDLMPINIFYCKLLMSPVWFEWGLQFGLTWLDVTVQNVVGVALGQSPQDCPHVARNLQ